MNIPEELYREIEKSISGSGFSSVHDYVVYVLRVSLGNEPVEETKSDERTVENRLRALGYI